MVLQHLHAFVVTPHYGSVQRRRDGDTRARCARRALHVQPARQLAEPQPLAKLQRPALACGLEYRVCVPMGLHRVSPGSQDVASY